MNDVMKKIATDSSRSLLIIIRFERNARRRTIWRIIRITIDNYRRLMEEANVHTIASNVNCELEDVRISLDYNSRRSLGLNARPKM